MVAIIIGVIAKKKKKKKKKRKLQRLSRMYVCMYVCMDVFPKRLHKQRYDGDSKSQSGGFLISHGERARLVQLGGKGPGNLYRDVFSKNG